MGLGQGLDYLPLANQEVNVRGDPSGGWIESAVRHLASESVAQRAGRRALLAKLTEALFIEVLRRYMAALPPESTGWLAAARDSAVGQALARIHRQPEHPWTLAELAHQAGVSRTVLAERFALLMGETPLAYLTRWRVQLGAHRLRTTDRTVLRIALEVGYRSESAFNRAFKRELGVPPARYRDLLR